MVHLKNTTALVALSAMLALPGPAFTQATSADAGAIAGAEAGEILLGNLTAAQLQGLTIEELENLTAAQLEGLTAADLETLDVAQREAVERARAAGQANAPIVENALPQTTDPVEGDAEATAEAPAGTAAPAEGDAAATMEAEAETAAPAEADAEVATETAPAEADAEVAAETAPAEGDADATMEADAAAAPAVDDTEVTQDAQAGTTVEGDAAQDTETAAEVEADTDAEASEQTAAEEEIRQQLNEAAEATDSAEAEAESDGTVTVTAESEADLIAQQREREERRAASQETQAAAAAEADAEASNVETEQVSNEDTRSSDEEFTTTTQANAAATSGDDDGLSKFEKALLLGLGAVAVGELLNNGDRVVANSGDRVVVEGDNGLRVLKNDNVLLRQPGSEVQTETFFDGSTRTTVTRPDGVRVVTIAAADGRVIQRFVVRPDGTETVLIDDRAEERPVDTAALPTPRRNAVNFGQSDEEALRAALRAEAAANVDRTFSLSQVRDLRTVRELAPTVELDAVTFATGSAAIEPSQAEELVGLGRAITDLIAEQPDAIILVEGHTDAVGNDAYNLALSDRRAETVALALTEYFDVPPENLVTQGYGESALKVPTLSAERANRRAVVRNITPLLR